MSAPPGNKYAEKWTYEKTMDRLCALEYTSHDDTMLYLTMALDHCSLYEDVWRYWHRKWTRNPEIIQMMKMIMQRFEVRLFTKMAKKEIPERVAMFALKHHYGWGKEPVDGKNPPTSDILAYVDQQLIEEPKADMTPEEPLTKQPIQTPASVPTVAPISQPIHREQLPPMEELLARAVPDRELSHKLKAYNRANPTQPITQRCAYFKGAPHPGLPAIPFEGGFFLTVK